MIDNLALNILIERLRTGWKPVAEEIDTAIPQHNFTHWTMAVDALSYPEIEGFYNPPTKLLGRDVEGNVRATGTILLIAPDRAWVVCDDGFWWLS